MNPKALELQARAHRFFLRVIALCGELQSGQAARSISAQLLASAGSTESNYRAACRARSTKEFVAKIGVAAEEADESKGWLEDLRDAGLAQGPECAALIQEANELVAIFTASGKTATRRLEQRTTIPPHRR